MRKQEVELCTAHCIMNDAKEGGFKVKAVQSMIIATSITAARTIMFAIQQIKFT